MKTNRHSQKSQLTDFQRRVYEELQKIPRGKVTTYKILAQHISAAGRSACNGKCRSARAVGQALKRNPFAPQIPCHRVIASDLTPGGFQGRKTGAPIRQKLKLLAAEGVKFKNGRLMEIDRLFR